MNNQTIIKMGQDYVMNTYGRHDFALVRGRGSYVWDADGNKYLDMVAGIAVNNVGHCHPKVVDAITEQAGMFLHCSNLYWIEPQVKLAKLLTENSFADKVFFCNSGAEANEAAIKLARKRFHLKYGPGRAEIITALNSFHGRTLTALTATGQEKYHKDFEPLTPGFTYVPYNDTAALEEAINSRTCAIMLEPLQGEGGVYVPSPGYFAEVRRLCDEHDLLLLLDEVQTGLGRTGKLFAYEHYGIKPDVMTLAKGLGGGIPIGACLAGGECADVFKPGDHAATFGGNPLCTAVALATMSIIIDEKLAEQAEEKGEYVKAKVAALQKNYPVINSIRGQGLLLGIALNTDAKTVQAKCQEKGVLVNCMQNNILRLAPPLNISYEELDKCLDVIAEVLKRI